jgi:hypothetical protein
MAIDYFVPGPAPPVSGLLGRLLPEWSEGVARQFIEAHTHPDAVVLDPFALSDVPIREGIASGRRMIATNHNPLVVLLLRQRLSPPEPVALKAALTRLGDSLKRGVPLREHLLQLYRTHCPACRQQTAADYFVWSREPADPRQKWVTCPACGQAGLAAVDDEDLTVLDQVETRGLHYWYLFNRVASAPDADAAAHVEKLMDLYTPRALYAIADLLMRIEAILDQKTQADLKAVLLHALGRASNLYHPETDPLRHALEGDTGLLSDIESLHPPARFVEHNVWRLFETAVHQVAAYAQVTPALSLQPDLHWVTRLPPSVEGLAWVHNLGVGALGRGLAPESVSLVLATPPRPNSVFWSLAYLWTGWLFGPQEAARLKELAVQMWPDWAWYQSAMTAALRAIRPTLRFDGTCILNLPPGSPQQAYALVLAALAAGYEVESWQQRTPGEHQFVLSPGPLSAPRSQELDALQSRVIAESARAARDALRTRGEPLPMESLHIAAWQRLLRQDVLETARGSLPASRVLTWVTAAIGKGVEAAETSDLFPLTDDEGRGQAWWLQQIDQGVADPLSDRVEGAVLARLREAAGEEVNSVDEAALMDSVYRRFNGPLTPDAGLVHACLEAYGEEIDAGRWKLHGDEAESDWQKLGRTIVSDLLSLGERLGYRAIAGEKGTDVVWQEDGHPWATFTWLATAHIASFLPRVSSPGAQPQVRWRHLVIPAARTVLWQHRLASQPWLAQRIEAEGRTFISLEPVRGLTERDEVSPHDFKAIIGLLPPVESGEGQLPLF